MAKKNRGLGTVTADVVLEYKEENEMETIPEVETVHPEDANTDTTTTDLALKVDRLSKVVRELVNVLSNDLIAMDGHGTYHNFHRFEGDFYSTTLPLKQEMKEELLELLKE